MKLRLAAFAYSMLVATAVEADRLKGWAALISAISALVLGLLGLALNFWQARRKATASARDDDLVHALALELLRVHGVEVPPTLDRRKHDEPHRRNRRTKR